MTGRSCSKRDAENLLAIVRFCGDIEYLLERQGSDEEDFTDDIYLQYSCVFCLIQIGEHVKRLSDELKKANSEIDWRNVGRMRDIIAHNYSRIDVAIVRSTALDKVPDLKRVCLNILDGVNSQ